MVREVRSAEITEKVKEMVIEANYVLGKDMKDAFARAKREEVSPTGLSILEQLGENAALAEREQIPYCQDTGFAVFFVEIGQDVHVQGKTLEGAINEGVRRGYTEGYLRGSIVSDPLERKNTNDNTPAIVYVKTVPGDQMRIKFTAKGGGSENMSQIGMLKPADGIEGVKDFIVKVASEAGPNACPPFVIGVGIGGTFDKAAQLAKHSLFRETGKPSPDPYYAEVERECLGRINDLGIGPQGMGGRTTALAVHVEAHPCHIASLPVAVNIQCHASRHREVEI